MAKSNIYSREAHKMSSTPSVPTLKKMVEIMLDENAKYGSIECRNSDIALTILIWRRWYNVQDAVPVGRLFDLPREDNVKRIRAVFQNTEHKYLPTDPSILIKRGIEEAYWFDALGYNLTADEWRRHHQTVKETKPPVFYDEATEMTDEQIDSVDKMLEHGTSSFNPIVINEHTPASAPTRITKMRAIYLPKSYTSSGLQTGQEYELELEQLATGRPIKMLKPIEAQYLNLQAFGKTWKVL
jgi:hypothetical protein